MSNAGKSIIDFLGRVLQTLKYCCKNLYRCVEKCGGNVWKSGKIEKRQSIDRQAISVLSRTKSRIATAIINTHRKSPNLTENQPITHHHL